MDVNSKTVWTAFWFALLGGLAFAAVNFWFWGEGEDSGEIAGDRPRAAGPLPPAAPASEDRGGLVEEVADLEVSRPIARPHQDIEDPGGAAMRPFYRGLEELEREERSRVAIEHYGDSILTSDFVSGQIRRLMQRRFGDGGHGFVLLGRPWRWYRHLDIRHGVRGEWRSRPLTSAPVADGLFGLGGVAFEAASGKAVRSWIATAREGEIGRRAAAFDVSYLEQPGGGSFRLRLDGRDLGEVSTEAERKRAAHHRVEVEPPGPARLEIANAGGGPLRMFGVSLDSGEPGVVLDSLAINGARASLLARFDEEHWIAELRGRDPSLLMLMFGANEGHNEQLPLGGYREELADLLELLRGELPDTACLVIGPLDQANRLPGGRFSSRRMPLKLSRAQREVALERGCAFFDTRRAMGGDGSMGRWFQSGLGGGDLVHPTERGARKIGNWIAEALLYGYQRYLADRRDAGAEG
ncbi:MAG: GDSL-type esterase/lipase family protein [Polyangia bacterium]